MSEKFTAGPWSQSHRQRADGMYATEVYDIDGSTIATVDWYPVKTATGTATAREANARLIAAAPDLFAALQKAQKYLKRAPFEVFQQIEAAIAKARA